VLLSLPLAKSLADFSQSQANTKIVCSQHTKHGTAEPFYFLHMGPMKDFTLLRRLCVADFGHAMCSCHCRLPKVWQISARAKPIPRLFGHTKHGTTEPFHFLHMGPMSYGTMFNRLCVADFGHAMCSCHCRLPLLWQISARAKPIPRLFAVSTPGMELKVVCSKCSLVDSNNKYRLHAGCLMFVSIYCQ
jgi:hypothetical protein